MKGNVQTYKDLIRKRSADGELEALAGDMLKAAAVNSGNWTGLWSGVLDRLCELPPRRGRGSPTAW